MPSMRRALDLIISILKRGKERKREEGRKKEEGRGIEGGRERKRWGIQGISILG